MQERIVKFIAALRGMGIRISLAESQDAFAAVDNLGVQDREAFRLSLRATLVKNMNDLEKFDELFPLFFGGSTQPPMMNLSEDLSSEEAQLIAEALRQFNQQLQDLLERLMEGDPLSQEEMERLAKMVGMKQADDLKYQDWMARRLEQALRFDEVREALRQLMETVAQLGMDRDRQEQMQNLLRENMRGWQEQLQQFAGQRIAENLSEIPRDERVDNLMNRPFNSLSEKDMLILREEVRRLAAILRSRVALRQKRAKSGVLDPKATIRANLKHFGVPIELKHKQKTLKPKLVVICDISTSMRYCSELMLSLIYTLQDQVSKTHAFAFIDHLEFITPDFQGRQADEAIGVVLQRMPPGYYSTDLGYALFNFSGDFMDKIDSRTSLIMVGDGRNNYNNPQIDIFKKMARRAHRTVWINPEPQIQWGTGDSDMRQYAPHCDDIIRAGTLTELTKAVDSLLG
jgi:hypothetical protein